MYSSLWQYQLNSGLKIQPKVALQILLLLSGDIEVCPGPSLKCSTCEKVIRKNQQRAKCEVCQDVFHSKCLFDKLEGNRELLFCSICNVEEMRDYTQGSQDQDPQILEKLKQYLGQKGLKILHQNVNGLLSKLNHIKVLLHDSGKNIHALGITESKLNGSVSDAEINIEGYVNVRKDRNTGPGGGVCLFLRDDLNWQRRTDLEAVENESIWVELLIKHSKSILLCICYRPPDTSKHLHKAFNSEFNNSITTALAENKEIIIIGDFNCNYLQQSDQTDLKDLMKINNLKQMINEPTRCTMNTETLIDLVFVSDEFKIANSFTIEYGISDHQLIGITRKMNCKKFSPRKIYARNYKHYSKDAFKSDLRGLPWEDILSGDLNSAWNTFKDLISSIVNKHAPMFERKITGRDCPWLTSEIRSKINHRDYLLRKAKRSKTQNDWDNYKRARNSTTSAIRKSKANYHRNLFKETLKSPKDFWSRIKRTYPVKDKISAPKSFLVNNSMTTDKLFIANSFCEYFGSVAKSLQDTVMKLCFPTWKTYSFNFLTGFVNPSGLRFTFTEVNQQQILQIVRSLKSSKSPGLDEIPPRLIIDAADELIVPLTMLINSSLRSGTFPTCEKQAKVLPVYKGNEKSKLDNYRPVSVTTVFSKIIEKVVYNQLSDYLESNNLICPNQFGFRPNRSTNHAVIRLVDDMRINMDNGLHTGVVFMDFRKAFDTIQHACLLEKLPYYGIESVELEWIKDYLFNRSQTVIFDNVKSSPLPVTHGVPQGSVIGPLLFNILINDISQVVDKAEIILYADDTAIYYAHKDPKMIQETLENQCNIIYEWLGDNNLYLNLNKGKTEFVLFGTPQRLSKAEKIEISINESVVHQSCQYTYLGVTLDHHLNLHEHLTTVFKKATSRLKLLQRIRDNLTPHVAFCIYNVMIKSQMTHCSTILLGLSRHWVEKLERVHEKANILCGGQKAEEWTTIADTIKRNAMMMVFKSLHYTKPELFNNYFSRITHSYTTRGNRSLLNLPRMRTEAGHKSFKYQGALIFNSLPAEIRNEISFIRFKNSLKNHTF